MLARQFQSPTHGVGLAPEGRIILAVSAIQIGEQARLELDAGGTVGSDRGWRCGKSAQPKISV